MKPLNGKIREKQHRPLLMMHSGNNYLVREVSFVSSVIALFTRALRQLMPLTDRLDRERPRLSLRMPCRWLAGK